MAAQPLIIYVPGLMPKPEPGAHRRELLRCLAAGVERVDRVAAQQLRDHAQLFDLVGWTYDFYSQHLDITNDLAAIDALIDRPEAGEQERSEAGSLKRRLLRSIYRAMDRLPFLIPHFADDNLEIHLRDLRRYVRNEYDIADFVRRLLKKPLRAAAESGRPIMLLAHSMGSVIAYDSLWQLSRRTVENVSIDLFITMGSPLGQRYIQSRLLGFKASGELRFPANIRRWVNIAATGELTAIDMHLANDFAEMIEFGLLESIEDYEVYNPFRLHGELNVHAEYGYLINEVTAKVVTEWLRRAQVGLDDDVDTPIPGAT